MGEEEEVGARGYVQTDIGGGRQEVEGSGE
jgi:hypothetical protein